MRVAVGALLLAGAFLARVLAGVGAPDEPGLGVPAAIRVSAAAAPGNAAPSGATPGVERIQREVEYEPIESYEEDGGGSNSGPGSDSSGPGSGGSDSSGPRSDDSGSGSSGSGSSGSDSSGEGS